MEILSKKIDTYKSTKHSGKTLDEYINYVTIDGMPIEAHLTIGATMTNECIFHLCNINNITADKITTL